jgi:hypothetical protein
VSPAYTALEYIRELNQYPAADFGSAKAAELGAATPDDAVKDALHAWQSANWDRLIALAPPDELPLYDYRAMINASAADAHPDFAIANLSTTSTVNGDRAVVKVDASGTFGSDPVERWQVGGTCPAYSAGWFGYSRTYDETSSAVSAPSLCLAGDLGQAVPFGFFAAGLTSGGASTSGPVSIQVVREDGRWFVSPVTTALDLLDSAIQHVDQRSIYTLLGIAYDLPPDGTITLDRPFEVPAPSSFMASRVYVFEGKAGQEIIGSASSSDSASSGYAASGEIYTADGDDVGYVDFGPYSSTVTLPSSGSYRLVLQPFGMPSAGTTLTLWDLANAPQSVRDQASSYGQVCEAPTGVLGGTSASCEDSGLIVPGSEPSNGGGGLSSCAVTNNTLKCGTLTIGQVCPTGSAPSVESECIPPEVVASFIASQGESVGVTATTSPAPVQSPTTAAR